METFESAVKIPPMGTLATDGAGSYGDGRPTIFAPGLLECKLAVSREKAAMFSRLSFTAMLMTDSDVPELYDILNHSDSNAAELDLSFNRLTDAGLRALCETLSSEGLMAHCLTSLRIGGNDISQEGLAAAQALFAKQRPDVTITDEARNLDAEALMLVGKVFDESPAKQAGMRKGDVILNFGPLSYNGRRRNAGFKTDWERQMDVLQHFDSIEASLKPLVAGAVDSAGANKGELDVVVAREGAGHLRLTLRPAQWSGAGLIGAKITVVELDDKAQKEKKSVPLASKLAEAKK